MPDTSFEIKSKYHGSFRCRLIVSPKPTGLAAILLPGGTASLENHEAFTKLLATSGLICCVPENELFAQEYTIAQTSTEHRLEDLSAILEHLKELPKSNGKVAVIGFGNGGTLSYLSAARLSPDAAIIYQGRHIDKYLNEGRTINCQTVFHVGSQDPEIAGEVDHKIHAALIGKFNIAIYKYEAGHAFADEQDKLNYVPEAADKAHERTLKFLKQLV